MGVALQDRPVCETWADHEFVSYRLIETGVHPVYGRYQTYRASCRRCGLKIGELEWTGPDRRVTVPRVGKELEE